MFSKENKKKSGIYLNPNEHWTEAASGWINQTPWEKGKKVNGEIVVNKMNIDEKNSQITW